MAVSLLQSKSQAFGNSASARSLAFDSDVTAGSLVVVVLGMYSGTTITVTDSQGQTYSIAGTEAVATNSRSAIYYVANSAAGPLTVTITPATSQYVTIGVHEYSGVLTASPLDSTSKATSAGSATPSPGSVTASSGELIVAGYTQGTFVLASCTVASPFTIRANVLNGSATAGLGSADDVAAGGSETPTFTMSSSCEWAATGASFKVAGGSPSDWTPRLRPQEPPAQPAASVAPRLLLSAALLTGGVGPGPSWMPFAQPQIRPPAAEAGPLVRQRDQYPPGLFPGFSPKGPGRGKNRPYVPRVPEINSKSGEDRRRRATEILADAHNALVDKGQLEQTGLREWNVRGGAHADVRPPNANDDVLGGFFAGAMWVDSIGQQGYLCISAATGAAVWKRVTT